MVSGGGGSTSDNIDRSFAVHNFCPKSSHLTRYLLHGNVCMFHRFKDHLCWNWPALLARPAPSFWVLHGNKGLLPMRCWRRAVFTATWLLSNPLEKYWLLSLFVWRCCGIHIFPYLLWSWWGSSSNYLIAWFSCLLVVWLGSQGNCLWVVCSTIFNNWALLGIVVPHIFRNFDMFCGSTVKTYQTCWMIPECKTM